MKRRRLIRPLFDRSRSDVGTVASGTIRILYRVAPESEVGARVPLQIGFAAGRAARSGVTRNRIRRLLREVYRVNQPMLLDLCRDRPETLTLMVLYRGRAEEADQAIAAHLPDAMRKLRASLLSGESSAGRETAA